MTGQWDLPAPSPEAPWGRVALESGPTLFGPWAGCLTSASLTLGRTLIKTRLMGFWRIKQENA